MSTTYSVQHFEITVEHPGHGYATVRWAPGEKAATMGIHDLTNLLHVLTARATGNQMPWSIPASVDTAAAISLLPMVQAALVRAAAGPDRARMAFAEWGHQPQHPVCVYCGEGSEDPEEASKIHGRCLDFGHVPFGQPGVTWAAAVERYETEVGAQDD